ncbi:hypothetical protein GCM10009753_38970 [Streptantibioticus ferralitis]
MTLRVYRVGPDGTGVVDLSSCVVRIGDRPREFNPFAFPPCECPRCRAEREEEQAQTAAALRGLNR